MKIIHTKFKDLKLIKTKIFKDQRGFFKEIVKNKIIQKFRLKSQNYQKRVFLENS